MTVSIKETSATVRSIDVTLPQTALTEPFAKRVAKYRKEVTLKGFRQGQVPKQMILAHFGDAIRQETIDEVLNETLNAELKKAKIVPVSRIKIEKFNDDKKNDIVFTAIAEVDPEIDIKGYEDLGIKVPDVIINEADVDAELARLKQMWSKDEAVDRPAVKGDVVVGNYLEVVIDGQKKDIPEEREFRTLLGESASPGFDEGLVGAKKGETKSINFVYPKDHKDEQYRGKKAEFNVEIMDVREIVPPKMDEEFFKQIGVKDEADLRANIQKSLSSEKKQTAKTSAVNDAIDKLIEKNPFEVPQGRVHDLIAYSLKQHSENKDEEIEPTEEQMKMLGPQAVREIKKHRILGFIADKEKIKPTQAMVDERLNELAEAYHVDYKSLKDHFRQSGRIVGLREELRIDTAADYIVGIRPAAAENKEEKKA